MIKLITYANSNMTVSAQKCAEAAMHHGADSVKIYGPDDIDENFYMANKEILDTERGAGLWLWKPYLIDKTLSELDEGDYLIYMDAGVKPINNLKYIIDRMKSIWLFGNMWPHLQWCKMDIINTICPSDFDEHGKLKSDSGWINIKQAQASVMFLKNKEYVRQFIKHWLMYCSFKNLIDDSESKVANHPEFRENRHDQAILTTLAYCEQINLHWWPAMYSEAGFSYSKKGYENDDYPVLFDHHRKRNYEYQMAHA